MRSLHASGWVKAPDAQVRSQVAVWAVEGFDFLSHTEATGRRGMLTGHKGYELAQAFGTEGQAEVALMVAVARWRIVSTKAVLLSSLGIPRRGGQRPYALHVVVEDRATGLRHHRIVIHLPSGVEGVRGLRRGEQARVWRDAVQTLVTYVAGLGGPVVITGDWNVNLRRAWFRALLADLFPDFEHTPLPKRGGTHGRRFIDFSLYRGFTPTAARVVPNIASDHRAVIERASIKEPAGMKLVTRAQWGASPRRATTATHPIGKTLGITAHWEGPHMGVFSHSECAAKVRGIERFHEQTRGWADLAYNALVCPHGFVFEGRGPGVQSAANGDTDTNDDWYAVCYLGGEGDGFTAEGKQGFLDAFGWLTREGDAGPKRNGHRDHKATACPGGDIYAWVSALPDGAGTPATPPPPAPKPPTRVSNARVLLEQAVKRAEANGHPRRAAALRAGLKLLPRR